MPIEWDADPSLDVKMAETDAILNLPEGTTKKQLTVESGLNPNAYNKDSKAAGLAQVIPSTKAVLEKRLGRPLDPYNPDDAIIMHREVMEENLQKFNNLADSLRAYNSGWKPSKWNNPETVGYVNKILPEPEVAWDGGVEWDTPAKADNVEWDVKDFAKRTASSTAKLIDLAAGLPASIISYAAGIGAGLLPKKEDIQSGNVNTFDPEKAKEIKDKVQQALSLNEQLKAAGLVTENPEPLGELVNKVLGEPAQIIANQFTKPNTFGNELARDVTMLGIPIVGHKALRAIADKTLPSVPTVKEVLPEAPLKPSESIPVQAAPAAKPEIAALLQSKPEGVTPATKAMGAALEKDFNQIDSMLSNIIDKSKEQTHALEDFLANKNQLPPNKDIFTGILIPDDPLVKNLRPEIHSQLAKAGIEIFKDRPELYQVGASVTDNLVASIRRDEIGDDVLAKYGLNKEELITAFDKSIHESAQRMAFHSQVTRALNLTKEQSEFLKKEGYAVDESTVLQNAFQKVDSFSRKMMISQFSTAVGNTVTTVGKIGIDTLRSPIDALTGAIVEKVTGKKRMTDPLDGLEMFVGLAKQNRPVVENILAAFPKEHDRMLAMFYGDVVDKTLSAKALSELSTADKVARVATWANRFQESYFRTAVFPVELAHQLRARGYDYAKVVRDYELQNKPFATFTAYTKDPKFLKDFKESVEASVQKSLENTFATKPEYGTLPYHIIQAINKMPFTGTAVFPFANYLYNHLKFIRDYNPLGLLQYLSKSERDAFMAGNVEKASKAVIGAAMFGVATQIINSSYGQGKFYEVTLDNGQRLDLRGYGPLMVPYLFAATVMKKSQEGTLNTLTKQDIVDGVAGVNFKGGTGLDLLDAFLTNFTNQGATTKEKSEQFAKEFAGNIGSRFFTPFQQLRDVYDQVVDGMQTVRDTKTGNPLIDPTIAKLPLLSHRLPPSQIPTREADLVIDNPILKAALAIRLSPPYNAAEKELLKYGFTYADLYPKGLDRQLAYEYSKEMGPLVEDIVGTVVATPGYKSATPAVQAYIIDRTLSSLRTPVLQGVLAAKPIDEQIKYLLNAEPKRIKQILMEEGLMK